MVQASANDASEAGTAAFQEAAYEYQSRRSHVHFHARLVSLESEALKAELRKQIPVRISREKCSLAGCIDGPDNPRGAFFETAQDAEGVKE